MTLNQKIRTLQTVNFLLYLLGIWYVINSEEYHWLGISAIFVFINAVIGSGVTLHRMVSHKSFVTYKPIERFLLFLSLFCTIGSPITFAAYHRFHHAKSDTPLDPHTPFVFDNQGSAKFSYKQALMISLGLWNDTHIPVRVVSDLLKDPYHKFLHHNYFKLIFVSLLILALINPWLIVFCYAIPASHTLFGTQVLIGVVNHRYGYRTYNTNEYSTNNFIAGYLSLGEGWHNNHHNNPSRYNHGEQWWEIDVPAMIIRLIRKHDQ